MFGTKVIESRHTKFNKDIKVIKSLGLGTYIQVNGLTQSGGVVESIWKYTLKKIKAKEIKTVLILGLGGGTVAKLLRKKYPDIKITGIEIDPVMVELGKRYLKLDEININIKIQDVFKFKKGKFDLIVVDIYCGDKYPKEFESDEFLKNIKKLMSKNGKIVFNRLFFKEKKNEVLEFGNKLKSYFAKVNLIYPQTNIMFICQA